MSNRFIDAAGKVTKKIRFIDQEVEIIKLTVRHVTEIQEFSKEVESPEYPDKTAGNIKMLFLVCRMGTPELLTMTDEELHQLPMDELTKLSDEILKYAGLGNGKK